MGQAPPAHEGSPGTRKVDHACPIHPGIDEAASAKLMVVELRRSTPYYKASKHAKRS